MMKATHILTLICGFLGGVAGAILFSATTSIAAKEQQLYTTNFYNNQGQRMAVIGAHPTGEGTLFLFDGNNKTTVQMGAYPSGSERGQALIGMNDRNNYLRMLFRLHGQKDSPTVVMKDSTGTDRIVFGLDGTTQEPYFRYLDRNGNMRNLIQE